MNDAMAMIMDNNKETEQFPLSLSMTYCTLDSEIIFSVMEFAYHRMLPNFHPLPWKQLVMMIGLQSTMKLTSTRWAVMLMDGIPNDDVPPCSRRGCRCRRTGQTNISLPHTQCTNYSSHPILSNNGGGNPKIE
jgi:hypothetical protein